MEIVVFCKEVAIITHYSNDNVSQISKILVEIAKKDYKNKLDTNYDLQGIVEATCMQS